MKQAQTKTSEMAVASQASLMTCTTSDQWKLEVQKAIPKEIALEAMMRVARSVATDSKFADVDPRSFLIALLKCGRAGLYPDGREAHLIPFGKDVQAIFDWKGLVALASRAGIMVTPKLVHDNDEFSVLEDDGTGKTIIRHSVSYTRERGAVRVIYSRAVMPDGRVDYEIMTAEEVENVRRHYSRAKDSAPWKNSWGEMAKKTVIKRHSKRWDMSPEIRAAINADDDTPPPINEPKVSTPIFTNLKPASLPPAKEKKPEPKPVEKAREQSKADLARSLYESEGINEETLVRFVNEVGFGGKDDFTTLDQADDETLDRLISQCRDIVEHINEANQ